MTPENLRALRDAAMVLADSIEDALPEPEPEAVAPAAMSDFDTETITLRPAVELLRAHDPNRETDACECTDGAGQKRSAVAPERTSGASTRHQGLVSPDDLRATSEAALALVDRIDAALSEFTASAEPPRFSTR